MATTGCAVTYCPIYVSEFPDGNELGAQQQAPAEAQAWEIYHGKHPRPTNDGTRFYVIRHNRLTGETQIIACEDRDGCTRFLAEIQD